jgi:trans-aconitate methyltransferase
MIGLAYGHPGTQYASNALCGAMVSRDAAPVQRSPDHALPGAMVSRDAASVQRSPDDARLYDRVLTLQAEAQWRADLGVLVRSPEWLAATTVLDLGAGNGAFGRRLAGRFPTKSIVALEPDAELHAIGARAAAPPNYAFLHGGFDPGLEGFFDVLLARGVLVYMPERRSLARWASEHCAAALIMNNAPEATSLRPTPTYHAELLSRTDWSHPADRSALEREVVDTPRVFAAAGFTLAGANTAVTELSGARGRLLAHHFLRASAEAIDAAALTTDFLDELFEWSHDEDAHLTMGATWYRFRNSRGPWLRTLS